LLAATLSYCSKSDNVVWHPIKEKIPHYDNEHTLIDSVNHADYASSESKVLELLHSYLNENEDIIPVKLDVSVGQGDGVSVQSIESDRLLILDSFDNRFVEYDLNSDSTVQLAEVGRGPGDIMLSREISIQDKFAYIALGGGRIEKFDCKMRPCQHSESFKTEYNPYSFTTAGDFFALLSMPTGFGGGVKTDRSIPENAIKVIDSNEKEIGGFGKTYDIGGHWLLLRPLVNQGFIRYSSSSELFILSYERFPFLYIYDGNFELANTFELAPFEIGEQKYWPKKGEREIVLEDHSEISLLTDLGKGQILVETRTKKNRRTKNNRFVWDHLNRYYLVSLSNGKNIFLGSKEFESYTSIYPTENNLILNNGGVLYEIMEEKVVVPRDN